MNPRKPNGKKIAQQRRMAAGAANGKKVTQIAREAGVSRSTASRAVNSIEGQLVITSLVERHRATIERVFVKALHAVEHALQADRVALDKDGDIINLGEDHYARLTAVHRLAGLLTAGRQPSRPEPPARSTVTLEELKGLLEAADRPGGLSHPEVIQ